MPLIFWREMAENGGKNFGLHFCRNLSYFVVICQKTHFTGMRVLRENAGNPKEQQKDGLKRRENIMHPACQTALNI